MMTVMFVLTFFWFVAIVVIFWAMIGYPISLVILNKLFKKKNEKDYSYAPSVSIMVVAHNEEKVIEEKLNNLLKVDYPGEKLEILVASDL